jgi:hypothetical protein
MGKMLWAILLVVVVVVAGGAWWLYKSLDSVVASAIRSYGPEITGVVVKVDSVKIQPADGAAMVRGLALGNPAGFKTANALVVGQISMKLDVASLTKDLVQVREITILQPEVTYEYASGGSNLDVIQRHVESYIAALPGATEPAKPKSAQKKLIIEHLYIKGARANVSAEVLQGKSMTVPLPDLHLVDIGKKSGGVTPAEAARQVVAAISKNATKAVAPLNLGGAVDAVKSGLSSATEAVKGFFK